MVFKSQIAVSKRTWTRSVRPFASSKAALRCSFSWAMVAPQEVASDRQPPWFEADGVLSQPKTSSGESGAPPLGCDCIWPWD